MFLAIICPINGEITKQIEVQQLETRRQLIFLQSTVMSGIFKFLKTLFSSKFCFIWILWEPDADVVINLKCVDMDV